MRRIAARLFGGCRRATSANCSRSGSRWRRSPRGSLRVAMIFADASRRMETYLDENAAFHAAVLSLADNKQLHELSARLRLTLIMAQVGEALTVEVMHASVREHRAIAKAIVDGDGVAAAAAMRAHLERAATLAVASREADVEPPPLSRGAQ